MEVFHVPHLCQDWLSPKHDVEVESYKGTVAASLVARPLIGKASSRLSLDASTHFHANTAEIGLEALPALRKHRHPGRDPFGRIVTNAVTRFGGGKFAVPQRPETCHAFRG